MNLELVLVRMVELSGQEWIWDGGRKLVCGVCRGWHGCGRVMVWCDGHG